MNLSDPVQITPRLLPGVILRDSTGLSTISIEIQRHPWGAAELTSDVRMRFRVYIDTPNWEYVDTTLRSGVGVKDNIATLRDGLVSFLSFLGAAAEEYRVEGRHGDDPLFPPHVSEWAYYWKDEIDMAGIEIGESPDCMKD